MTEESQKYCVLGFIPQSSISETSKVGLFAFQAKLDIRNANLLHKMNIFWKSEARWMAKKVEIWKKWLKSGISPNIQQKSSEMSLWMNIVWVTVHDTSKALMLYFNVLTKRWYQSSFYEWSKFHYRFNF